MREGDCRKFYIDKFVLMEFLKDITIVVCMQVSSKEKINIYRVVLGSLIGTFGTLIYVVLLLKGISNNRILILLRGVMVCLIVSVTTKWYGFKDMTGKIIRMLLISFLYGGIVYFSSDMRYVLALMATMYIIYDFTKKIKYKDNFCKAELYIDGNVYRLKGIIDTGNVLTDPFNGKAVHVVGDEKVKISEEKIFRYIPYHSVGVEHGMIKTIIADKMVVYIDGEEIEILSPSIAIYKGRISSKGEYDILINSIINQRGKMNDAKYMC